MSQEDRELFDIKEIVKKWFSASIYTVLDKNSEEWKTLERLTTISEVLDPFLKNIRQQVKTRLEQNQYDDAIVFVYGALAEAAKLFADTDNATTAKIMLYRRLGFIYEHRVTFGDLSKLPLGDKTRSINFLRAARRYMLGDLETGYVSDFALRISECFAGAQLHELQEAALKKCFGDMPIIVIGKDPQNNVLLQDLANRATEVNYLGNVPFGGEAKVLAGKTPNAELN